VTAAHAGNADFIVNTCRLLQQRYAKAGSSSPTSCLLDFIKKAAPEQSKSILNTGVRVLKSGVDGARSGSEENGVAPIGTVLQPASDGELRRNAVQII
jgi:hypothetical protein